MSPAILSSQAAGSYLQAFDFDPFARKMDLPVPIRDGNTAAGYRFEIESVTHESADTVLVIGQTLEQEAREILGSAERAPLIATNNLWSVERALEGIKLISSADAGAPCDEIFLGFYQTKAEPGEGDLALTQCGPHHEATMIYQMLSFPDFFKCGFDYALTLRSLSLTGLRKKLGLESDAPLEAVHVGLFELLGVKPSRGLWNLAHWLAHDGRLPIDLENGQAILIATKPPELGREPEEEIEVTVISNEPKGLDQALPECLHSLWKFAMSQEYASRQKIH